MAHQNPNLPPNWVIAPPRPAQATDRYDGPTLVYRMYDADDRLLYVGVTCNKAQRWERHRDTSVWWKLAVRKELTTYPDRSAALTAEREAIRTENPIYNVVRPAPRSQADEALRRALAATPIKAPSRPLSRRAAAVWGR